MERNIGFSSPGPSMSNSDHRLRLRTCPARTDRGCRRSIWHCWSCRSRSSQGLGHYWISVTGDLRFSVKRRMLQEAVALFLDHGVTLATQLFQFWPVQHRDLPAAVFDHAKLLQLAGGFGDAFTTHAEHVGDELLRHGQLVD